MRHIALLSAILASAGTARAADCTSTLNGVCQDNLKLSGIATKSDAIPTTPPGPNSCRFTWVPSNLVQSGGVTGTAGKCSRIVQCGDSSYTVQLFDIGSGC